MSSSRPKSQRNASGTSTPKTQEKDKSENRRARRQREKDERNADAGPSNSSASDSKISIASGSKDDTKNRVVSFQEADFIPFELSDTEVVAPVADSHQVREWDRGKGKGRERGPKRKTDEVDLNDGYVNKKQRVAAASRKAPWVKDVDWDSCTNVSEMLHREVEAFVEYVSPTPVEDEVRSLIVALVSRAVTREYPDAQVLPFGSYETKLYLPIGDIDLVIYSQSMAYSDKVSVLHSLANTIKRAGITDRVTIIAKAKVPIVKFVTTHGRFSVDISINQGNGVTAGKMIKLFLAELPALRSLVLIIKSFLSQRSMNEVFTGGLGSYSIVCLAISFLQMHPKIRRGEIDPSKNLGVLVMEFFELYGCHFNYHEVGISLRDGGTYFNKRKRGWMDYGQPKLLSIEDPGDMTNDISRGSYGIAKVRMTLAGAYGIMTAAAYLQAGVISARREGRTVHLRDTENPEDRSILASVMGVTQETINHRKLVQEVYDRQVLHRMLGVVPQETMAPRTPQPERNGKTRAAEEESVKSAWEEADMDLESAEEDAKFEAEDESRYEIRRSQPPKKRRRVGGKQDLHTVYTTDDDDDGIGGGPSADDDGDGTSEEEHEYDLSVLDDRNQNGSRSRRSEGGSRKRSYWLSKGIGGDISDD
ncbi:Poly(A) RNA polymerase cid14 [Grifola frondosa]|uniref:polynucleotide adenylyltransferase n=1 Tax=Grifola frondosa TaxID=5627 RepID=A0A1C7LLL1_GRIFR|nr:Poly(A) RNA polymerase cid14 [Grifola frondosa]